MFRYAFPTLITSSIYSFIIFSDTFFLTLFKGVSDVGIYNIALPLASISVIVVSPINNLFLPLISHLIDDEKEKVSHLFENILKVIPFVGLYFGLFTSMFPKAIVGLLFGSKWIGLVETPLVILSMGYIAAILATYLGTFLMGIGLVKERFKASLLIGLICLTTNSFLIYFYGTVGAAIGASLIHLITIFILGRIIKKSVKFHYPWVFYLKLSIFSIVFFSLVKLSGYSPENWISLIISGGVYTLIMIASSFYLNVFDKNMLRFIFRKKR